MPATRPQCAAGASRFRVYVAGQKRGLTAAIKRAFRRRAAVEPVIGHLKSEHRMGRNHLAHGAGDAINAVLAAVGYNFRLLLKWLALLCARARRPRSANQLQPDHRSSNHSQLHGRRLHNHGPKRLS